MVPGQSCWRKVYVATSREAELESPPPRGTELTTTALKPMSGEAAGVGKKDADKGSVDVGKKNASLLRSMSPPTLRSAAL